MAERRMFAKTIIDSDAFIDMPVTARLLYYDLGMRADDDGFVNSPKKIMRMVGASEDDLRILIGRKFIIPFESGIVVIKHWRIHNYIQNDRKKATTYKEELAMLTLDENKAYTMMDTECIQDVYNMDTQVRLGKDSIGKDSIGEVRKDKSRSFTPPTLKEVEDYCTETGKYIDAEKFINFYESKGWMVGKNKMVSWKAAVNNWAKDKAPKQTNKPNNPFLNMDFGGGL